MSLLTSIYQLIKPELTDSPPDITVMNPNWDAIDAELASHEEQINSLAAELPNAVDISSALVNGWSAYNAGFYGLIVTKSGNMVNLKGHLTSGTVTKGTVIATLPEGYRPYRDLRGDARQFGNPCVMRMIRINYSTGAIIIDSNYDWIAGTYDIDITYPIS